MCVVCVGLHGVVVGSLVSNSVGGAQRCHLCFDKRTHIQAAHTFQANGFELPAAFRISCVLIALAEVCHAGLQAARV
ncbi:MAG: hypothetical protein ACKERG_03310 [Candidatus Hodgkinia cicadicola]